MCVVVVVAADDRSSTRRSDLDTNKLASPGRTRQFQYVHVYTSICMVVGVPVCVCIDTQCTAVGAVCVCGSVRSGGCRKSTIMVV